ncbi:hypothetical protein [Thalassospira sp. MIT1370]|uniref:hypothetical protein n=1 Tax=unclassified Thalassospira TaxID=2648997 RepID=UPI00399ADB25
MVKRKSTGIVRSCMVVAIFVTALLLSFELLPSAQADAANQPAKAITWVQK